MMILITVLVGLSIGGLWLYRRRTVATHVDGPTGAAEGEETGHETGPEAVPDAQRGSVSRAPSAASQLRDSLLATEVSEVGFDDQVASDLQEGELDRAIMLLKRLIQARPADIGHRMRLLSLLHAERRSDDFVREAADAMRLKPPLDEQAWGQVCAWGAELDPGNKLFTGPGASASMGGKHASTVAARDLPADDLCADKSTSVQQASTQSWAGSERRTGKDRRVSISPWLGVERRKADRRRSVRPTRRRLPSELKHSPEPAPAEPASPVDQIQERCANA